MSGNGSAPRLRVALDRPASTEEAAAIAAALELFVRDTAPPPALRAPARSLWARAALLEGLRGGGAAPRPWGDPEPWGERVSG